MILKNKELKKKVTVRFNRVTGQINGIKKMIESNRDYEEVIIQVSAIRAALGKIGTMLLLNNMEEDIRKAINGGKVEKLIGSFNKIMKQMHI